MEWKLSQLDQDSYGVLKKQELMFIPFTPCLGCIGNGVEVLPAGRGQGWCSQEAGAQNIPGVHSEGRFISH